MPIIFPIERLRLNLGTTAQRKKGVPPNLCGRMLLPTGRPALFISGVTKDSTGATLGGCTVKLYRTFDDRLVETVTSDGSGNYTFLPVGPGQTFYVVAYKPGSPDVAGTTVNTLVGT